MENFNIGNIKFEKEEVPDLPELSHERSENYFKKHDSVIFYKDGKWNSALVFDVNKGVVLLDQTKKIKVDTNSWKIIKFSDGFNFSKYDTEGGIKWIALSQDEENDRKELPNKIIDKMILFFKNTSPGLF